jgi:hypothetical protein
MTCKRILLGAVVVAAACGNYSNEDLEFMNALPDSDLAASIPARSSAVTDADEAELARTTHQVTRTFNGLVAGIVGLVDAVRRLPPSSRTPDSRTWGPYPSDEHPGWLSRMIVTRDPIDALLFRYEIAFHRAGGDDLDWPLFLSGQFRAGQTVHHGDGMFQITTAATMAEGLDVGFGRLDHMEVTYDTRMDPATVSMAITNLPNPLKPDDVTQAAYAYKGRSDGQGQMTFDLWGDFVLGPAIEKMTVTSQWLGSGEGLGVLKVQEGDGAGSMQTECWNTQFRPTYNSKPWAPLENVSPDDPSACPSIPLL